MSIVNPVYTITKPLIDIIITSIARNSSNFFLSLGLVGNFFVSMDTLL